MNFLKVNIFTESSGVDILVANLMDVGVTGFDVHDSADFDEFLSDKDANWDYVDDELDELKNAPTYVSIYLADDTQGREMLSNIHQLMSTLLNQDGGEIFGSLHTEAVLVKEEDWENNWKEYYKPFPIGKKTIIKPSWEDYDNEENKLILEIDPASSFGTGQHSTTKLCIETLEEITPVGGKVLDLGCGSGILSIASLLYGASHATLVDISLNSVNIAAENVQQNHFDTDKFVTYCGDICSDTQLRSDIGTGFDIVVANIVADVIIAMSGYFGEFLKQDGRLIVSGIIDDRLDEVKAALSKSGYEIIDEKNESEWNMMLLKHI